MRQDNITVDEAQYQRGYEAAFDQYVPGHPAGDPVGVHDDYQFGWWVGVGEASAWHEGYSAAEKGVMTCPYTVESDQECFREPWIDGFMAWSLGNTAISHD